MGLISLQADINERRLENGASVVFEDQYPVRYRSNAKFAPELIRAAQSLDITPDELFELRKWIRREINDATERLNREMAVVYTLNAARDRTTGAEFITKMEASEKYPIAGGDLLDLDYLYGGMFVREGFIFISEAAFMDATDRYEPADILNGMFAERSAA